MQKKIKQPFEIIAILNKYSLSESASDVSKNKE
jgi:hypothetical protein